VSEPLVRDSLVHSPPLAQETTKGRRAQRCAEVFLATDQSTKLRNYALVKEVDAGRGYE
jgi:hypothetical protein